VSGSEGENKIGKGLAVLAAVSEDDTAKDAEYLAEKTANLRIFPDGQGKLNLSVKDIRGEVLAVPQFTLYGDCRKGRRPSFDKSAQKEKARKFFDLYVNKIRQEGLEVKTGFFGDYMKVRIINDGPVTLIIES